MMFPYRIEGWREPDACDTDPPPTDPCPCERSDDELEEMFRAVEEAREREIAALRETVQLLEARCSGLTALLEAQRKS